jgi:ABC-2 type transport system ATP-binding protein
MTFALEAVGLGRRYGKHWALQNCSVHIPTGRVVALVGPNGAGKTTFLHLSMGLLDPSAGDIQLMGYSPRENPREVLSRVGFVAQSHPLYSDLTIEQHLQFGARVNKQWDIARARERLAHYEIPFHRKAGKLSGGQKAQVALALALAKRPQLLLLDEPLASLDPLARQEFLRTMLVAATEEHITVVFSSHGVAELGRFCDFIVLIAKGHVQLTGDIDALLARHKCFTTQNSQPHLFEQDPAIVSWEQNEREVALLVQSDENISRVGWTPREITLEKLILGYMANPSASMAAQQMGTPREGLRK